MLPRRRRRRRVNERRVTAKVFALHLEVSITEPRVFLFFDKTAQRCCWKKMEHTKNKLDPCEPQWQDKGKGKGMLYSPGPWAGRASTCLIIFGFRTKAARGPFRDHFTRTTIMRLYATQEAQHLSFLGVIVKARWAQNRFLISCMHPTCGDCLKLR
jgi:hypothetical protein